MLEFTLISLDDLEFLNEVRNECSEEYLHDSRVFSIEDTIDWFHKTNPNYWIITQDGERIGYFRTSNHSEPNKNIYVGADIHVNFRGKGLGYEAYMGFLPILFEKFNLHKISLEVLATNTRAIHLYEKIGFTIDGVKRDEVLKNGEWVDSIIMSILKDEYEGV